MHHKGMTCKWASDPGILSACARRSSFRTSRPRLPSASPISTWDRFWRVFLPCEYLKLDWYQPQLRWTDGNDFEPLQTWADSSSWPIFQSWRFPRISQGLRADTASHGGWAGNTSAAWGLHSHCWWWDTALTVPALLSLSQHGSECPSTALSVPALLSLSLLSQVQPELVCCSSFTADTIYTLHLLLILCIRAFVLPVYLRFRGTFLYSHGCCLFLLWNVLHFALIS